MPPDVAMPKHALAALTLAAALACSSAASAFAVNGSVVDLAPTAEGGALDLRNQVSLLEAARRGADPTAGLLDLMRRLETNANRRAAFAWIVATSSRPAVEGPAALYALAAAGVTDARAIVQAAVFAQAKGARAADLYRWAAAAQLPEPGLGQLARIAGAGRDRASWRVTRLTAPPPAAAGGG